MAAPAHASAAGVESPSATCGWPLAAFAERAGRRVLLAESSLQVQLAEVLLLVLVWRAVFSKIRSSILRLEDRPWFEKAVARTQETMRKSFGTEVDLAESARTYANTVALSSQHVVGAMLCLPAVLCILPPDVRSALTRHGALSEVAWEIMDICEKVHQRWISPGGARGREEVPDSILLINLSHHVMATTMVVPVNLFYSDARAYAALVFSLQFAAGVGLAVSAYLVSLDLKVPSQLLQMQALAVSQVLLFVLARGVVFAVAAFDLVRLFHRDRATVFLALSAPAVLGMSLLNYIFIADSWRRMRKFLRWAPEKQQVQGAAAPAPAAGARGVCGRRLSAASVAAVELNGAPAVGLGCAPPAGWLRRRRSSASEAVAAAVAAVAHAAAEGRLRLSGAAAAPAAARAAAEAAKATGAQEASPRTPDTDAGTSANSSGTDGEDFSDFGASSDEE